MRVLFVYAYKGKSPDGKCPIIYSQGESLARKGINIEYYKIPGRGLKGYIQGYIELKRHLKNSNYDIVHGHYSYSAIIATLSNLKGINIASIMGEDEFSNGWIFKFLIKFFSKYLWKATIAKSDKIKARIGNKKVYVIPNGVNFEVFHPIEKSIAISNTKLDKFKKNIIFVSDLEVVEKNYPLAIKAYNILKNNYKNVVFNIITGVLHSDIVNYYNAADLLLMTSSSEGSPNVIKEAMACNCPIVSTDVGDVKRIIEETEGCFITSNNANEIAEKMKKALELGSRTNGRENIRWLKNEMIADKIIGLYNKLLESKRL